MYYILATISWDSLQDTYMIQDVVSLLAGSNLNKLPQEKWCSLGNGAQLCDVL